MSNSSSYSWLPNWLLKFLNLDDELPNYGPSSSYSKASPAPPSLSFAASVRPASTYTPSAQSPSAYAQATPSEGGGSSRFASYLGTPTPEEAVKRFSSFPSAPPSVASPPHESGQRPAGPPPLAPRPVTSNGDMSLPGAISETVANGFVQPIGFAVRSFARGALPPQGLDQFNRELGATMTDVWNFYTYWIRFETDDLFQIGREAFDAVTGLLPSFGESVAITQPRRIKVTQAGDAEAGVKRTTPTPPPTPTAVFSRTVAADAAVVPPAKDISAERTARVAKETAPIVTDVAETTTKVTESVKAEIAASAPTITPAAAASPVAPTVTPAASASPVAPTVTPASPVAPPKAPIPPPAAAPTSAPSASAATPPATPSSGARPTTPGSGSRPTTPGSGSRPGEQSKDRRDKGRK